MSRGRTEGARSDATIGFNRTLTTDDQGFVRLSEVPPGFYTVATTAASGFGAVTVNDVEVVLGKTTPVRVSLQAGGVTERVEVSAADALSIDPTDNKIQTNITAQIAELLPKGTNFTSLLKVSPSTRAEPLSGGFQVDGASGSENTFIIDGQEVTNFRTGVLNVNNNLPFQLVQEVQVKSSGFEAEFGGATGGVINVVTKGGSNEWHGEFGAQFRTSRLQGDPNPFLRRFASTDTSEYLTPRKDKGTDYFPTATLSGPIKKDRLWFFASYTPQFLNTERTIDYFTPGADPATRTVVETLTYDFDRKIDYTQLRLDAAPSDKIRLTGTFTYNPVRDRGALPAVTEMVGVPQEALIGGQVLRGPAFLGQQGGRQNANNVTGAAIITPNDKMVISLRGGRSFLNEKLGSYGIPSTLRYTCNAASFVAQAALGGCTPGQQNFVSNFQIAYDVSTRKTFDADMSYLVSSFGGRHQFKGGYQYNGISNTTDQGYADIGQLNLIYGVNTIANQTGQAAAPGAIGVGVLTRFGTVGEASSASNALYFQDSWQPTSRLSINLGIRIEHETVPTFAADNPGITFGWGSKPAPRLGFAYDVTGNGRTKLFASYGWFYDRFKYELPRGSFGGDFFRRDYFDLFPGVNYNSFTVAQIVGNFADPLGGGGCESNDPAVRIAPGALSRCQFDFRVPSNRGLDFLFESGAVDPDIKSARQSEFTVGLERDLTGGYLFRGRYTHKNIDRAIEDIGLPAASGSEAYIIGNPGFGLAAETAEELGFPVVKAVRKYDALEVQIDKRFTRRYYFNVNYTLSRLYGNYSGLASSLEAGRTSPNVSRLFDLPFQPFAIATGERIDGRLPTDRPHVFKFYGAYTQEWNGSNTTEFSGFTTAQSGSPLTTIISLYSLTPAVVYGQGDLGRTEAFTQTDFAVRHKYRINEKFTLVADIDFLNLFDERNELGVQNTISNNNITATQLGITGPSAIARELSTFSAIFNGGVGTQLENYLDTTAGARISSYGLANSYQTPREIRFGFRLLF